LKAKTSITGWSTSADKPVVSKNTGLCPSGYGRLSAVELPPFRDIHRSSPIAPPPEFNEGEYSTKGSPATSAKADKI